MSTQDAELNRLIQEQEQAAERKKRILAELLQEVADRKGYVLAHHSGMGHTLTSTGNPKIVPSFAATHTLSWIANNILLGSEMPFMENKIDAKTGRLTIDEENAEEIKQRAPDWTRQPALAAYLAQPQRKFGPIIAVLSPAWIDQPQHENWGSDGRAIKGSSEFIALDLEGRIGLLKLDGTKIYALDGQHRVIGIRGIKEVSDSATGLTIKNKDGLPKPDGNYTREDFLSRFRLSIEDLQSLMDETMLVEYIPAVIRGETRAEASRRIRNTFISINSYAKSTAKGENILLDETDGYAIIARKAGLAHPWLNASSKNNRVNWKTTSIPKSRTTWYTTLQTVREMSELILPAINPEQAKSWSTEFKEQMPIRPQESELEEAKNNYFTFLDHVLNLPVFQALETGTHNIDEKLGSDAISPSEKKQLEASRAELVTQWREFPTAEEPDNKGHLLMRPVGQIILADAVATLTAPKGKKRFGTNYIGRGLSLDQIFEKLQRFDEAGGFAAHLPSNPWWGVTFDEKGKKMITTTKSRSVAHDLLVYMIDGMTNEDISQLWIDFADMRMVDLQEKTWRNLEGQVEPFDEGHPQLPVPIK